MADAATPAADAGPSPGPGPVFRTTRRVEFGDTDMAGIVHFVNFFRYMEAAETEFLRSRGLSVAWQRDGQRVGFPRVNVACEYYKPAYFEDVLTIEVRLEKIGEKSLVWVFDFLRGDELLARGKITSVCCRSSEFHSAEGQSGKGHRMESVPIPPEIRAKLNASA